jgi:hypothetical protein
LPRKVIIQRLEQEHWGSSSSVEAMLWDSGERRRRRSVPRPPKRARDGREAEEEERFEKHSISLISFGLWARKGEKTDQGAGGEGLAWQEGEGEEGGGMSKARAR